MNLSNAATALESFGPRLYDIFPHDVWVNIGSLLLPPDLQNLEEKLRVTKGSIANPASKIALVSLLESVYEGYSCFNPSTLLGKTFRLIRDRKKSNGAFGIELMENETWFGLYSFVYILLALHMKEDVVFGTMRNQFYHFAPMDEFDPCPCVVKPPYENDILKDMRGFFDNSRLFSPCKVEFHLVLWLAFDVRYLNFSFWEEYYEGRYIDDGDKYEVAKYSRAFRKRFVNIANHGIAIGGNGVTHCLSDSRFRAMAVRMDSVYRGIEIALDDGFDERDHDNDMIDLTIERPALRRSIENAITNKRNAYAGIAGTYIRPEVIDDKAFLELSKSYHMLLKNFLHKYSNILPKDLNHQKFEDEARVLFTKGMEYYGLCGHWERHGRADRYCNGLLHPELVLYFCNILVNCACNGTDELRDVFWHFVNERPYGTRFYYEIDDSKFEKWLENVSTTDVPMM